MTENLHANAIRTYSGLYMDVFNPTPEMICIEDIAHALSNTPRFGGHLKHFYSVAQHSIFCANNVNNYKMQALMHDASEAYLTDIPSPIKKRMPQYKEVEHSLMLAIAEKFGFNYPLSQEVKDVDYFALTFEWEKYMIAGSGVSVPSEHVEQRFLTLFNQLKK